MSETSSGSSQPRNARPVESVLDFVGKELTAFSKNLGTDDKAKVQIHLDSIRSLEQLVEHQEGRLGQVQRWVRWIGRDRRYRVAGIEHGVAHAPVLTTKHHGHLLSRLAGFDDPIDGDLQWERVALDAMVPTRESEDELNVGDSFTDRLKCMC